MQNIYNEAYKDEKCFEITVEDASIEFQFVRDCKDFDLLKKEEIFSWTKKIKEKFTKQIFEESKNSINRKTVSQLQKKYKLTRNQIKRIIEIMKFIHLDEEDVAFPLFKKEVQERLKKANKAEFYPFIKKKLPYVQFDGFYLISFLFIYF